VAGEPLGGFQLPAMALAVVAREANHPIAGFYRQSGGRG
jgi:hypothetical protein